LSTSPRAKAARRTPSKSRWSAWPWPDAPGTEQRTVAADAAATTPRLVLFTLASLVAIPLFAPPAPDAAFQMWRDGVRGGHCLVTGQASGML
jgi:hypothetical protein